MWIAACLGVAVLVGWASMTIESLFAPLLFFPLLVGVFFGGLALGLLRQCNVGSRAVVTAVLVVGGGVLVVTQHYAHYHQALEEDAALEARLEPWRGAFPEGLPERLEPQRGFFNFLVQQAAAGRPYLYGCTARGVWAWASWGLDAAILIAAALGVVLPALGQPYCTECRHWYRTTRSQRLDREQAQRLAALAGAEVPAVVQSVRVRLLNCQGGCGPTGLVLTARRPEGVFAASAWLDAAARRRAAEILDTAHPPRGEPPSSAAEAPPQPDGEEPDPAGDGDAPPVDGDL